MITINEEFLQYLMDNMRADGDRIKISVLADTEESQTLTQMFDAIAQRSYGTCNDCKLDFGGLVGVLMCGVDVKYHIMPDGGLTKPLIYGKEFTFAVDWVSDEKLVYNSFKHLEVYKTFETADFMRRMTFTFGDKRV